MKNIVLLFIITAITGCISTYTPPPDFPSATLSFDLRTDSTGTTGKHFSVWAYDDIKCTPSTHGKKLASQSFANNQEKLGPVKISAKEPLTFAVLYQESRFAQTRNCSFTASFAPSAGRTYSAQFEVTNQSVNCSMQITDERGEKIAYQTPEISCAVGLGGKVRNGGAGVSNWDLTPITVPAKK